MGRLHPLRGTQGIAVGRYDLCANLDDIGERALYQGLTEQDEFLVVRTLVQPGDFCVDVGSNIGVYTALLRELVGPEGTVVSFEPAPWTIRRLQANLPPAENWTLHQVAVGSAPGATRLSRYLNHDGASSLLPPSDRPAIESAEVDVVTLDDMRFTQPISFMKVDVEGFESHVYKGAAELFRRDRIRASLWEASPCWGETDFLDEMVGRRGYETFMVRRTPTRTRLRFRTRVRRLDAETLADARHHLGQFSVLNVATDAVGALGALMDDDDQTGGTG